MGQYSDLRAPEKRHSLKRNRVYREYRSVGQKFFEEAPRFENALFIIAFLTCISLVLPVASYLGIPCILIMACWAGHDKQNRILPIKLPIELHKQTDYHEYIPGKKHQYGKAQGAIPLGNLSKGSSEVWVTGRDILTHMLYIGATGAGKTQALISLAGSCAFAMGGGLIYVDAKAAIGIVQEFFTLARLFGREDDIRIISYRTGGHAVSDAPHERLSNTANPFNKGTANTCSQTLLGSLPSGGGENQVFLDKAIGLLNILMPALVELRDKGVLNITPGLIGDYINLTKVLELANNVIMINDVNISENVQLSERIVKPIKTYIMSFPGTDIKKSAAEQPQEVERQFGFAKGYFARTLANLAGTYGHIYQHDLAEADVEDIILHGRILLVMIPATEQSKEERAGLAKVVLSAIRVAMSTGLGRSLEGKAENVLDSLPIDLRIPTLIIVDEYAEAATEGFAITATQGRGLGISVCFSGQDLAGFLKASKEETDQIFGNTTLKFLGKLLDPEATWERFRKLAGQDRVAKSGGWESADDGINTLKPQRSATIEQVERLDINDLKDQREGQVHLLHDSDIHRVEMFHHGLKKKHLVKDWRINRMLKIKPPSPAEIAMLQAGIDRNHILEKRVANGDSTIAYSSPLLTSLGKFKRNNTGNDWPIKMLKEIKAGTFKLSEVSTRSANDGSGALSDTGHLLRESVDRANEECDTENEYQLEVAVRNPVASDDLSAFSSLMQATSDEEIDDGVSNSTLTTNTSSGQIGQPKPGQERVVDPLFNNVASVLSSRKHAWIFEAISDEEGLNAMKNVYDDFVTINASAGLREEHCQQASEETIESIVQAVNYQPVVERKDRDLEQLMRAIEYMDTKFVEKKK